jgi:hypothetical protein
MALELRPNCEFCEESYVTLVDVLKDRLNSLKADRDRARAALERAKEHFGLPNRDRSHATRALWPHDARALHHRVGAFQKPRNECRSACGL